VRSVFALFLWTCLLALSVRAAVDNPFPMGYSMGNFGTIMWPAGVSGRQPWTSAALLRVSPGFGLSAAGTYYFDRMDNFEDSSIRRASAGAWMSVRRTNVKVAYMQFNAIDVYREQTGFVSAATRAVPFVSLGAEITACRSGLVHDRNERENTVSAGATLLIPWSFASAAMSCSDIVLKDAHRRGFTSSPVLRAGIHTAPHRFGAQGVVVEVEPGEHTEIRFNAGGEYWIQEVLGIAAALSTNPLMVSFGVTVSLRRGAIYASLVHHPVLGWSKGTGADFFHQFRL
jgi:hypothetical protein